jgi:four helix bundle protein
MTLKELPKHELYETGSQIRRAVHSVRSNVVEGYGRRRYKAEFIKHLVYAHASCDEASDHLEALWECGALGNEPLYQDLHEQLDRLGRKLNLFIQAVEREHRSPK